MENLKKQFFIGANWKLHFTLEDLNPFFEQLNLASLKLGKNPARLIIFPQTPLLSEVKRFQKQNNIDLGSQNSSALPQGAYTGESSPKALKSVGAQWTLVGHSERRALFGDTNEICLKKFDLARKEQLKPLLCIGEEKSVREKGFEAVKSFLKSQLDPFLSTSAAEPLVIAYEPVWAIGTGLTPQPAEVEETLAWIRSYLSKSTTELFVIYGGSVNRENAASFLQLPSCHGLLIGGVSLKPLDLREIFHMATHQ
jgi:triosephosphate isomerase